jgi:hypothetical protein
VAMGWRSNSSCLLVSLHGRSAAMGRGSTINAPSTSLIPKADKHDEDNIEIAAGLHRWHSGGCSSMRVLPQIEEQGTRKRREERSTCPQVPVDGDALGAGQCYCPSTIEERPK